MKTISKDQRENFWYSIPGAYFGASQPIEGGVECYVVVDAEKVVQAIEYFQRHRRTVKITETRTSPREPNALHITYSWLTDLRAAAEREIAAA